jgi:hypothetical protein
VAFQGRKTAAARGRPGERLPSCARPRGLPGHGKPSTASRSVAHSPASERPLDLPWERSDLRGVWGHVVPTRSASLRPRRVRPALAASPWWRSCWCTQRGRVLTQESCGSTLRSLEGGRKARGETDAGRAVLCHCSGRRSQSGERRERRGEPPQEPAGVAQSRTFRSGCDPQSPLEGVEGW